MLSNGMDKLKSSLSCITYNGAQHTNILIKEDGLAAMLNKVTLKVANGDWISLNPDKGSKCKNIDATCRAVVMSPLLAIGNHDHHRACDCVVVVNRNGNLTVVYIDLKSGNPNGYAGQFKSTRQFMRYTLGLIEEFHQVKLSIADERYVILYGGKSTSLNKTPTIPKMDKSQPNNPYKREVNNLATLYLKELLG